ncbi:MAG: sel1 repeat family protein [Gammaproteobacteria bacterium]|nr:sel1 repeat family protein [Gammaproteobacteria bacterium]
MLSEKLAAGRSELSEIEQKRTDEEQRLNAAQDVLERTQEESQRLKEAAARLETLRLEQLGQQATSASLQSTAMESAPGAAEEPGTEAQTDPAERQLADGIDAYERGRFDEAYSILAPLADRGKREAQLRVAAMFAAGRGVQQDYAKAASWYRNVAELGDGDAQISVAGMYESGTGVPQSNMMAYVWYSIAARSGNAEASASRDRVATRLQPAEIQQAERLIAAKLKQMGDR